MTQRTISHRRQRISYRRMAAGLAVAASLSVVSSIQNPVSAQSNCGQRTELVTALSDRFNEAPVAAGLSQLGQLIEVFSSADGTTWTLMVTKPDGESCLIAAGEAWLSLIRTSGGPEA